MGDDGSDDSGLEALAARGRALREERERAAKQKSRAEARAASRRALRGLRHTLFASSAGSVLGATASLLVAIGLPFAVGFAASRSFGASDDAAIGLGAAALAFGLGLCALTYVLLARAAERAERAWIASLPFDVHGYFEILMREPPSSADLLAEIRFVDERPDPRTLADAAAALSFAPAHTEGRKTLLRRDGIDCSQNDGPDTNSPLLSAMRHVIDDLLVPLHVSHRVAEVRFRRE